MQFNRDDSFKIIRASAAGFMRRQFKETRKHTILDHEKSKDAGQEIYRRNFRLSNFEQGYNSKLAPTFLKARVRQKCGYSYYELEDLEGISNYDAKDIRQ